MPSGHTRFPALRKSCMYPDFHQMIIIRFKGNPRQYHYKMFQYTNLLNNSLIDLNIHWNEWMHFTQMIFSSSNWIPVESTIYVQSQRYTEVDCIDMFRLIAIESFGVELKTMDMQHATQLNLLNSSYSMCFTPALVADWLPKKRISSAQWHTNPMQSCH